MSSSNWSIINISACIHSFQFVHTKKIVLNNERMNKTEWIRCPVCWNKTRLQIREDTEPKNFPLYCPKCEQESLIEAKDLQVTVIKNQDQYT